MYRISRALPADAYNLFLTLREVDETELRALGHTDMYQVIRDSVSNGINYSLYWNNDIIMIYGCNDGVIWMLASDYLYKHKKKFWSTCKNYVKGMKKKHSVLYNMIDYNNNVTKNWLKKLGFTLGETFEYNNHPFQLFFWRKVDV